MKLSNTKGRRAQPPAAAPIRALARASVWLAGTLLCLSGCRGCEAAPQVQVVEHGQFEHVRLYKNQGELTGSVLLASDAQGWDARAERTALQLTQAGAVVVGIDTSAFLDKVVQGAPRCIEPAGDLDNLARFAQAYLKLPQYAPAVLIGLGIGASLSVAAQLQVSDATFAGVIAVDFCDAPPSRAPLCTSGALGLRGKPERSRFVPTRPPAAPIFTVSESPARECEGGLDPAYAHYVTPESQLLSAYAVLARRANERAVRPPAALQDLPVVEVPAAAAATQPDVFVVLISGDGGWAGIDRSLAEALSTRGVPCVGLDSLRYFWSARTPAQLASDVARIVQHYQQLWGRARFALVGFSQGADVLPFAVNRLPPPLAAQLVATIALGISSHASFEFHIASWVGSATGGLSTLPELRRLAGQPFWCVYGDGDDDSVCPQLSEADYHVLRLPGGHHFGGDYEAVAKVVLRAIDANARAAAP